MRCRAVINPQGDRTSWSFKSRGQTILQRLANGSRVSSAYDADQRLIRLANLKSDGTVFSRFADRWDGASRSLGRLGWVESSGSILTRSYENTYRLTREQPSGTNSSDGDVKPGNPNGDKTFRRDQRHRLEAPTHKLPYVPDTGKLK